MAAKISPLAPGSFPALPPLAGVAIGTAAAGIRYTGRTDVVLMRFDEGTAIAGVFTRSLCPSAPVDWCRAQIGRGTARGLVVNSGNANAFTGSKGKDAATLTARTAAEALSCAPEDVFLASTGVIGEPLDATKFEPVLRPLAVTLDPARWEDAARAIMTTDTFPKGATARVEIDGVPVTINGIAKGAGMIAPDMATMLAFIATDASLTHDVLQAILTRAVDRSFNCITVDGDTSTSDTVLAFATRRASHAEIRSIDDARLAGFIKAFEALMMDLAQQVARDGEGATKFLTVNVSGAVSDLSARRIGLSIANSPLVKTAIAGEDANWGRVVMAVGKAGEPADRDRLSIWFGGMRVAFEGARDPGYDEAEASKIMKNQEITIRVDLGLGQGQATVWSCDLTNDYIMINADYRS